MDTSAVLLDQGWFRNLDTKEDWENMIVLLDQLGDPKFSRSIRLYKQKQILSPISQGQPRTNGYYLLERAFEFDRLIIDKSALRLHGEEIPQDLKDIIFPITPQLDVYNRAGATIIKESQNYSKHIQINESSLPAPWPKTEYYDRLFESYTDIPASLAQSKPSNDWERALFYLAFADELGVTPLISGPKARYLSEIGIRTLRSQHETVQEIFDTAILEEFKAISEPSGDPFARLSQQVPPILEYITSKAIETNTSAFKLFQDLRYEPSAIEYRQLLVDLREAFAGGRNGHIEALRMLKELKVVADSWASTLDVKASISYTPRKINLKCIPIIGKLLELAGMNEFEIRDKILTKTPGYLVFCSHWYSDDFKYAFGKSEGPL